MIAPVSPARTASGLMIPKVIVGSSDIALLELINCEWGREYALIIATRFSCRQTRRSRWRIGSEEWGMGSSIFSPLPTPHSPLFCPVLALACEFPRRDAYRMRRARNQPLSSGVKTAESRFASLIREVSIFASHSDAGE